jgi:hypothetical protein
VSRVEYVVVLVEGLIALAVTAAAWRSRRAGPLFLSGLLMGMAWCAFLHGFCFGVLRVEGPRANHDPVALVGFELTTAIFLGIPIGALLVLLRNLRR